MASRMAFSDALIIWSASDSISSNPTSSIKEISPFRPWSLAAICARISPIVCMGARTLFSIKLMSVSFWTPSAYNFVGGMSNPSS